MTMPLMSLPVDSPVKAKYVVPWKSRKEFLEVYKNLYSDDEGQQIAAINRITTWKSRAGSKLSVAVENTAALFDCIINHKTVLKQGLHNIREKHDILRSSYGLAIIRFVNFVTEKGQTKQTAQPVHTLAKEYGIPEWIVRIRHDVTHNVIPCLDMLANAALWAVQYLKEEFWDCQNHDTADIDFASKFKLNPDGTVISDFRKSLSNYQALRLKEIEAKDMNQRLTADELLTLRKHLKDDRFTFVRCILEDGYFIPTEDQLPTFQCNSHEILNQPSPCLPSLLVEFWSPVLTMLCNLKVISMFTKVAVFSLTEEDILRNHLIAGWLDFILHNACTEGYGKKRFSRKSKLKKVFFADALLHKKVFLSVCLNNVNRFTIHLLRYLLDKDELGEDAYLKLVKLLHYTPDPTEDIRDSSRGEEEFDEEDSDALGSKDDMYTIKDLLEVSIHHSSEPSPPSVLEKLQAGVQDEENGWKVCTDIIDWSKVPLGIIPSTAIEIKQEIDQIEEAAECGSSQRLDQARLEQFKEKVEEDDLDEESCEEDNEDEERRHTRDWKWSDRKRMNPLDLSSEWSSSKRSTYVVNDTELL